MTDTPSKALRHAEAIQAAIEAAQDDGFRVVIDGNDLDLNEGYVYRYTITTLEP
jgi:acyl-CoA reductase-like NAD-dependent aldehyde dehydrogenase